MDKWWTPLLLIIGVGPFLAGFFVGTRVVAAVLVRRERRLAVERRVLNEGWVWLYRQFGVDKPAWMATFSERQQAIPSDDFSNRDH